MSRSGPTGLRGHRLRVALTVLTVFGMPLVLMLVYLGTRRIAFEPPFGDQPGGRIGGRVLDAEGSALEGVGVTGLLLFRDGTTRVEATATSAANGDFALDLPPVNGCYLVRAGEGVLRQLTREISLVEGPADDLTLVLEPGCDLAVTFDDSGFVDGGSYQLTRRAGGWLGLAPTTAPLEGRFEGAALARGGLAPGEWTLRVDFDGGGWSAYELTLEVGRQELTLKP